MPIKRASELVKFTSPLGETVEEVFGAAVGGAEKHSVARITISVGGSSARHYHPIAEESYSILSGTGRVTIDGVTHELAAGDSVSILAKSVHQIFNTSATDDLVFIAVCCPPWTPDCSVFLDEHGGGQT